MSFCRIGFLVDALDGTAVFEIYDVDEDVKDGRREPGSYRIRCEVPAELLKPGRYGSPYRTPTCRKTKSTANPRCGGGSGSRRARRGTGWEGMPPRLRTGRRGETLPAWGLRRTGSSSGIPAKIAAAKPRPAAKSDTARNGIMECYPRVRLSEYSILSPRPGSCQDLLLFFKQLPD